MANLLDQASIVLTPTAYDDGKVLCAKPSEAPYGDFDFSRNSAATRVNAQGLVENVQILSSNLVQNGDFSEEGVQEVSNGSFSQEGSELVVNGDFATDSDWTADYGASQSDITISNGELSFISSATYGFAKQQINVTSGKIYKITADIKSFSGSMRLFSSSGNAAKTINSTGIITNYFTPIDATTLIGFSANNDIGASVVCNSISCVEVGQDWTLGTGWSIGEDKANGDGSGTAYSIALQSTPISALSGNTIRLEYTISNYVSGIIRPTLGVVNGLERNSNGTFIEYIKLGSNAPSLQLVNRATALNGSITNISVKEVGQNWSFTSGATLTDIGAKITHTPTAGSIAQLSVLTIGKQYKLTYEITESISGGLKFNSAVNSAMVTTVGVHTKYFEADNTTAVFSRTDASNNDVTITNISLIEISSDTNLPRINYEGFSYQDALGSELVTNGDFATDLSGWSSILNVSWSSNFGDSAFMDASSANNAQFRQTINYEVGKTYRISWEVKENNGCDFFRVYNNNSYTNITNNYIGTHYFDFTHTAGLNFILRNDRAGSDITIDNVSVKEYLGQEVVPDSGCGHWLWEPQSTNLIPYSEDFSNAAWGKISASVISNVIASPSGEINASKIVENNTNNFHFIQEYISVLSGANTFSFYAKADERTQVSAFFNQSGNNGGLFDLSAETATPSGTGNTANIESVGNGWYRCVVSNDGSSQISNQVRIGTNNGALGSYQGDGTSGVYIWGAQVEQQSYATSYIPTSGSTVTRNQDVCANSGSLATINSTEGTLYGEFSTIANDNKSNWINISDGTAVDWLFVGRDNNNVRVYLRANNSVIFDYTTPLQSNNKVALSYKSGDIKVYINGVNVSNSTNAFSFTSNLNSLDFNGYNGGGTQTQIAWKAVAVWKEALSDQELADLTYPTPTDPTFALNFDTIATDFTFARGSEATYVDAQGLIQSTNELGPELITNGSFDTDSDWLKGAGTTISGGSANLDGSLSSSFADALRQVSVFTVGKTYKVTYTISDYVSGANIIFGDGATEISANGTYTEYITATITNLGFQNRVTPITCSIDNVSVKEYITATNTPRLDYSTGAEAFLLEPQSTNLVPYSEDFSNSSWLRVGGITTTDNYTTSPSGQNNATRLQWTNATNYIYQSLSHVGSDFTLSIYLKSNTNVSQNVRLFMDNGTQGQDAVVTTQWQRFEFTNTTTPTQSNRNVGLIKAGGQVGDLDISIWGAQFENQSYATSYIPTENNPNGATRNQETCINATPEINSEEGVLYIDVAYLNDTGTFRTISINDGTNNNQVSIENRPTSNQIKAFVVVEGVSVMNSTQTLTDVKSFNKMALKWSKNNFSWWVNGVKLYEDLNGDTFSNGTLTKLNFNNGTPNFPFEGNTKDVQVYTKALSDAELIKLTT